jgi:hypothetical protein
VAMDNNLGPTGGFSADRTTDEWQTTGKYTQTLQYTASWCPNCGRRRGPDGRCASCDPWWTMPVVQYSAGLSMLVLLLLLGGIAIFQPHNDAHFANAPSSVGNGAGVAPTFSNAIPTNPPVYSGAVGYTPPPYSAPHFTPVNYSATMSPNVQELQWRAIEQLREATAYTDAVVEQRRQEQWQERRAFSQSGPMSSALSGGAVPLLTSRESTPY